MKEKATSGEMICALATNEGESAIALIRISGNGVFDVLAELFRGKRKVEEMKTHHQYFGEIHWEGEVLDEVLVTIFRTPSTYTGEDLVEISCHGSSFIVRRILSLLNEKGIRPAYGGEFTMRAYLNGKMDLSQAESVADLIAADSRAAHRMALAQMRGGYSEAIGKLRQELIDFASLVELELDFSEEDVEFADRSKLMELVEKLLVDVGKLVESFATGNVLKSGLPVAIVGEPNAGKSTLLNALLKEDKAIVSDVPGTTRDVIEDEIIIDGVKFRFIDTAGIRETTDKVENLGIERTYKQIDQSAVVLQVVDAVKNSAEQVKELVDKVKQRFEGQVKEHIIIANKVDELVAVGDVTTDHVSENFEGLGKVIYVSAREGTNVELIGAELLKIANVGALDKQELIVTNARHHTALKKAHESLTAVKEGMNNTVSSDFLAMDIRQALHHLGEITGEVTTDDLLGNIFSKFCIGK